MRPDKAQEIKSDTSVANVIANQIPDKDCFKEIKDIAKRAWWLGCDSTHYETRYKDHDINDLKEKIMIADNHLDDRVIEIIKIMYIDQMKKEMEDDTLLNILFDYNRDNYCFLVFFQKKGIGKIPLTREFYRQVEDKYKDAIKEHSMDSFMKVDMEWAGKILFKNHNKFN